MLCALPATSPRPDFSVQFEESKADFSWDLMGSRHRPIDRPSSCQATGYVYVRPFARLFLEVAARLFEAPAVPWDAMRCHELRVPEAWYVPAVIFRQVPRISHPLLVRINCCRNLHILRRLWEKAPVLRQLYLSFHFPLLFRFPRYGF